MSPASSPRWPGLDHPGFVPASLLPDPDADEHGRRRSMRDWVVDLAFFGIAVGFGILFYESNVSTLDLDPSLTDRVADYAAGGLVASTLWWRRRWPVVLAAGAVVPAAFAVSAAPGALILLFTVGVHRPSRVSVPMAVLHLGGSMVFALTQPSAESFLTQLLWSVAILAVALAWSLFVRARRQLVISLRERAERAEAEQRLLADQARLAERNRIAREMHDVLGHRVSLIALHAGGLELRPDLPPQTVRESAGVIRSTARQALEELRDVIGVLRDQSAEEAPPGPQPALADIDRLVEDSRRAGANVRLEMTVERMESAPPVLGRDAYRIVQEALTNVHKHVRGAATTVSVSGGPGDGLRIEVANRVPVPVADGPRLPGSGSGLVGLAERVSLSGGTLQHGPTPDGRFVVEAMLKWTG
ncbi:MAG: sensor histidine kinase [Nocardioidaceae bacterium]